MRGFRLLRSGERVSSWIETHEGLGAAGRAAIVVTALALGLYVDRTGRLDGSHLGWGGGPIDLAVSPDGERLFVAQINEHAVLGLGTDDGRLLERDEFRGRPLILAWSSARGLPLVSFQDRPEVCEVRDTPDPESQRWFGSEQDSRRVREAEPGVRQRDVRCFLPGAGGEPPGAGPSQPPKLAVWGMVEEPDGSIAFVQNDAAAQPFTSSFRVVRLQYRADGWARAGASPAISLGRRDWAAIPWPVAGVASTGELVVAAPPDGRIFVLDSSLQLARSASVGRYVKAIAVDESRQLLYAADEKDGVIREIELRTLAVVNERAIGGGPCRLLADPEAGVLWVAGHFADRITALAMPGLEPRSDLPARSRPSALAFDRSRGRLFVAQLQTGTVVRWDGVPGPKSQLTYSTLLSP